MNDAYPSTCPRCGTPIPADTTDSLCPACLLSGVLNAPTDATVVLAPGELPPVPEPKAFPCDFGGYRLQGLLGQGGMGTVYDAEQIDTGRRVALKRLGHQFNSPEMRLRFLREGRLAAGVSHPNSLYVYGSEEIEGVPVITMEVADAGTLQDLLDKRGPLPVAEAVDAILDVISGLEAAHRAGVLHRDIKPSNCFVVPDGSVKIGDFGLSVSTLARDDTFVTASGMIMGTPAFASPEQLRGDALDLRADIYSVGATLFTLLTNRAPFEGKNAVQVVANAVNQKPKSISAFQDDVPPALERVVTRCLAKEPGDRFADYMALRNALLPFSSREPAPAPMKFRAVAGWIDFLLAFLVPYVVLMFSVGAIEFHVMPLIDRTLYSARYYFVFLGFGFLYFTLAEGIWGGGLGKRIKGLRVIRPDGRPPGLWRAFLRILTPILSIEILRVPFLLATINVPTLDAWTGTQIWLYIGGSNVFPWMVVLLNLGARRENGFAAAWDRVSGTRVVFEPKGRVREPVKVVDLPEPPAPDAAALGPYQVVREQVPGQWIIAVDPVLRRKVWLLRRAASGPSPARRRVSRAGRLRWLQEVVQGEAAWDAFEAIPGVPFTQVVEQGQRVPWVRLRQWLHDMASELWEATRDGSLPAMLSLDHVWITPTGQAILLDEAWPDVTTPAEPIPVGDVVGQQRFLNAMTVGVDRTRLPLHARPVLQNLARGKFEKLSFLTGSLLGLLDRPAEVGRVIRAGSMFMLPLYVWITVVVGIFEDPWATSLMVTVLFPALAVLGIAAFIQVLLLPFRFGTSLAIFRLAVVNDRGESASRLRLLARWAVVWLPLALPLAAVAGWSSSSGGGFANAAAPILILWLGAAAWAALHPHRGLHDRLAGTWVVRQ